MVRTLAALMTIFALASVAWATEPADAQSSQAAELERTARAAMDRIVPKVAALRGLDFKRDVPLQVIDDAGARDHLKARLERFDSVDQLRHTERFYKRIGLLEPGDGLVEVLFDAVEEQAAGFYDPQQGRFYVLDDVPENLLETVMAHELVHALEDQYFDLDGRIADAIDSTDRAFAVGSVHEGSATVLMTLYMIQEQGLEAAVSAGDVGSIPTEVLDRMPPVLFRQLVGPYVLGTYFLLKGNLFGMSEGFPVDAANAVMDRGPTSSEQILHPSKFWDEAKFDAPREVDLPDLQPALGRRWQRVQTGDLGEMSLAVLVDEDPTIELASFAMTGSAPWTHPAAAGWGGDVWELWSDGKRDVAVLATVWDSAADAQEFAAALRARHPKLWVQVAGERVDVVSAGSKRRTKRVAKRLRGS